MDAPDFVFSADVSIGARLVLVYLWRHARADRPTAWPSARTISLATRQHIRSVRKQLAELNAKGWIGREGVTDGGSIVWCVQSATPGPTDTASDDQVAAGPGEGVAVRPLSSLEEAQVEDTTSATFALTHPDDGMTLAQRRVATARYVWKCHEEHRVESGLGRHAAGGGLREPAPEDLNAIVRCALRIKKQERISDADERRAWGILRAAALAAVDRAVRARDEGDDWAERYAEWRRTDPFGGKKLDRMLAELERQRQERPRPTDFKVGANVRSDEERRELERRVLEQQERRLRVVNDDTSQNDP